MSSDLQCITLMEHFSSSPMHFNPGQFLGIKAICIAYVPFMAAIHDTHKLDAIFMLCNLGAIPCVHTRCTCAP